MIQLYKGDCLEVMDRLIKEGVVVDAIICDPPYNTTACHWDKLIPFDEMWERLNKLIKPNGAIVLFGSEPFSSALRMSNIKNYKYDWVWKKSKPTGNFIAKRQPMRAIENILVFYNKQCSYNPQMIKRTEDEYKKSLRVNDSTYKMGSHFKEGNGKFIRKSKEEQWYKSPINYLEFKSEDQRASKFKHPTQKPVKLMEYLIKTYTNENELVLDFTAGSGSTLVGCINTNRRGIGIEMDENYYNIATKRIEDARGIK